MNSRLHEFYESFASYYEMCFDVRVGKVSSSSTYSSRANAVLPWSHQPRVLTLVSLVVKVARFKVHKKRLSLLRSEIKT